LPCGFDGSLACPSEQVFQFGEDLFDRVEIRTVRRQEEEPCACGADGLANGITLVAAEIVHDHNVSGLQTGHEDLLDIEPEALAIDWAIKDAWRINPVVAQGGKEGHGLPMAMGHMGEQPLAFPAPAPDRRHVGLGPGLIDEHKALDGDIWLELPPRISPSCDVRPVLFGGVNGFF